MAPSVVSRTQVSQTVHGLEAATLQTSSATLLPSIISFRCSTQLFSHPQVSANILATRMQLKTHHDQSRVGPWCRIQKMVHAFFFAEHDCSPCFQLRGHPTHRERTPHHHAVHPAVSTRGGFERAPPARTRAEVRTGGE